MTNSRLHSKNGLGGRSSQVQDSIIESGVKGYNWHFFILLLLTFIPHSIFHLEGKSGLRSGNNIKFFHLDFQVTNGTFCRLFDFLNLTLNVHNRFVGDFSHVFNHRLRSSIRFESNSLYSVHFLSQDQKCQISFHSGLMNSGPQ